MSQPLALLTGFLPMLLLKSTLLLLAGFGVSRILSGSSAATRHLVWAVTLIGLIALPVFDLALPGYDLALLPATTVDRLAPGPVEPSGRVPVGGEPVYPAAAGATLFPVAHGAGDSARMHAGGDRTASAASIQPEAARSTPARPAAPGGGAPGVLGFHSAWSAPDYARLAYGLGTALVLSYLGLGLMRVTLMRRRAEPLDDFPEWQSLVRSLETSSLRPIRLCRSRDVEVPFTWGIFRPTILLPWEAARWPANRKRDVLVHELSHVDRLDWLTQLSARMICALYWFHPLVWIASRNLFLEAERTCDDRVLASGARSHDYAQHLLELAGRMRASRVRLVGAVAMARRRQLPVRIEAILDEHLTRSAMSLKKKALIGLLTLAPALLLASAHLTQAEAEIAPEGRNDLKIEDGAGSREGSLGGQNAGHRDSMSATARDHAGLQRSGGTTGGQESLATVFDAAGPPLRHDDHDDEADEDDEDAEADEETEDDRVQREAQERDRDLRRERDEEDHETRGRQELDGYDEHDESEDERAIRREIWRRAERSSRPTPVSIPLNPQMTPLMLAAADGDLPSARTLVDRRNSELDVDEGVAGFGTPLILAANNGQYEMVRFLLDRQADPNRWETAKRRFHGLPRSPLAAAVRSGEEQIVELLLDRGARPNATPTGDASALMEAARRGHFGVSLLLLNRGAGVNQMIRGDGTPLIAAARGGNTEIVALFLDRGADPTVKSPGDGNALIAAARSGNTEVVRMLLDRGADPDAWVRGDESAFFHALRSGDSRMIREMIDAGADVNATWYGDGTPLILASKRGEEEIVEALLDAGAHPSRGVEGDGNPLIQAAGRGDSRMVARLVENGADVNEAVEGDGSPLIAAAKSGDLNTVQFLVAAGADVNMIVPGDENPLMAAAEQGHLDVVRFLVNRGADINMRIREQGEIRTALRHARKRGHDYVVDYLLDRGARD